MGKDGQYVTNFFLGYLIVLAVADDVLVLCEHSRTVLNTKICIGIENSCEYNVKQRWIKINYKDCKTSQYITYGLLLS